MIYWTPSHTVFEDHVPLGGWNSIYSNQDKLQCTALYASFKKKGYSESHSWMMSQMLMFKAKYKGMKYSKEQEEMLQRSFIRQ